jgi:hypothetical protein
MSFKPNIPSGMSVGETTEYERQKAKTAAQPTSTAAATTNDKESAALDSQKDQKDQKTVDKMIVDTSADPHTALFVYTDKSAPGNAALVMGGNHIYSSDTIRYGNFRQLSALEHTLETTGAFNFVLTDLWCPSVGHFHSKVITAMNQCDPDGLLVIAYVGTMPYCGCGTCKETSLLYFSDEKVDGGMPNCFETRLTKKYGDTRLSMSATQFVDMINTLREQRKRPNLKVMLHLSSQNQTLKWQETFERLPAEKVKGLYLQGSTVSNQVDLEYFSIAVCRQWRSEWTVMDTNRYRWPRNAAICARAHAFPKHSSDFGFLTNCKDLSPLFQNPKKVLSETIDTINRGEEWWRAYVNHVNEWFTGSTPEYEKDVYPALPEWSEWKCSTVTMPSHSDDRKNIVDVYVDNVRNVTVQRHKDSVFPANASYEDKEFFMQMWRAGKFNEAHFVIHPLSPKDSRSVGNAKTLFKAYHDSLPGRWKQGVRHSLE